ncbi:peptidase A24 [Bombiscardovia nodaiensis]|uniref:Peptidase A24 n=1 Tax=Bombiscardovia nodaiensis TaxID=2932181 RepID=A0ABM8B864_9BIFI|nr:peptidase A24 [Bombiscardovia nodaiensis]
MPRFGIALGILLQLLTLLAYCALSRQDLWPIIAALGLALASTVVQTFLALIRPGALGFGDVTATALVGLSLGVLGWQASLAWWLLMGAFGLVALGLYYRWPGRSHKPSAPTNRSLPFLPIIVGAALTTDLIFFLGLI